MRALESIPLLSEVSTAHASCSSTSLQLSTCVFFAGSREVYESGCGEGIGRLTRHGAGTRSWLFAFMSEAVKGEWRPGRKDQRSGGEVMELMVMVKVR